MRLAKLNHPSAETMNELRALNARFIHNFVTNDVPSHDAILHPAFINIWPTGQRWDRATYLKYWATAFDPKIIVYWDVRDELITVIGDVALVRATNKHTRRRDGQEVTGMTMYTDCLSVRERRVEVHPGPAHIGCSGTPARRRDDRQRLYRRQTRGTTFVTNRAGRTFGSTHAERGQPCHHRSRTSMDQLIVMVRNILSTVQIWRARAHARRELAARSERELRDMGTSWSSIADEVCKPFWRA